MPLDGKPLLLVKREKVRAGIESPLEEVVGLRSIRELPSLVRNHRGKFPETLGLELDILPAKEYFKYHNCLLNWLHHSESQGIFHPLSFLICLNNLITANAF